MGKAKSTSNGVKAYEKRFAALEGRVAAAERKLAMVWNSQIGCQLRMMELSELQRAQDADEERRLAERRLAAAADRAKAFGKFIRERVAVHRDLSISARLLKHHYELWCTEKVIPRLHWVFSDEELVDALSRTLEAAEPTEVPTEGYAGKHPPLVPGFSGIGLCPQGESPAECVERLKREESVRAAERMRRREDHQFAASVEDAVIETRRMRDEAARLAVEAARK